MTPFFQASRRSLAYQFTIIAPLLCPPFSNSRKFFHFQPCFGQNFSSQDANFPKFRSLDPSFFKENPLPRPYFWKPVWHIPTQKKVECPPGLQNRAAKIITGSARMDSSTEARNKLKWLNLKERYQFHLAVNMFKVMNGQAPNYLANRFNIKDSGYAQAIKSFHPETKNRVLKKILLLWCDIVEFPTRCNKKFVQSIAIQEEIFQWIYLIVIQLHSVCTFCNFCPTVLLTFILNVDIVYDIDMMKKYWM